MKIETLKRGNKWYIIGGVVIIAGIIIASVITTSRARYRTTQSIPLVRGTINYKPYDFKIVAIYKNDGDGDVEVDVMPDGEYKINQEKSYCTIPQSTEKDSNALIYTNSDGEHVITNIQKLSKCYLYFNKKLGNTMSEILAGFTQTTMPSITGVDTTATTKQVYSVADDYGTSYVFRGAPTDNWVKFGGYYWRIIRMNGDGSTRMIYAGTSTTTTGTDDQLSSTSAFNSSYNDNAYVGYMYGTAGSSTYEATHANTNNSTIKGNLDTWYSNLSGVASYIDGNAGFCNDRQSSNSASGTYGTTYGYGTNQTYYKAYNRLITNKAPNLKCTNNSTDLFTTSGSSQGNGKLSYPVGLITADEVVYAGGYQAENKSYYLYTGEHYWTMSPSDASSIAFVFYVDLIGFLNRGSSVSNALGVRPVINLKSSVEYTGTGTSTDPFTLSVE